MKVTLEGPLQPGSMLGSYEVVSVISVGHTNAIYAAIHKVTLKEVAIRILLPELAADPIEVKRCMGAARALSRISHDNVQSVYDFGMNDAGLPYAAIERISGRTMQSILKEEGTLNAPRLRRLLGQVCLGMEAVHAKRIVHRDLKPANIMVSQAKDKNEKIIIIDFNCSTEIDGGRNPLTLVGELIGTPYYMSPEQCMGQGVDQRSDIYSLGCCMFEAMTGSKPIVGDTMVDTMSKQISQQVQVPPDLPTGLKGLAGVALKCLEKDPQNRFQSMTELHKELVGKQTEKKPGILQKFSHKQQEN